MNFPKSNCSRPAGGTSAADVAQALRLLAGGVPDVELPRTRASVGQWVVAAGVALAIGGVIHAITGVAEVFLGDE
jgi:hypothetical protein